MKIDLRSQEDAIMKVVDDAGTALKSNLIAARTGFDYNTMKRTMARLVKSGQLVMYERDGKYGVYGKPENLEAKKETDEEIATKRHPRPGVTVMFCDDHPHPAKRIGLNGHRISGYGEAASGWAV